MSHFTVLIIGDDFQKQLAPFKEYDGGIPSDEMKPLLVFEDTTDEHMKDYMEKSHTMVQLPDGELRYPWDEEFKLPKKSFLDADKFHYPLGTVEKEVFFKDQFATFGEYMKNYCEEEPNAEKGLYGFFTNPNSKWDWYRVGGRWSGFFTAKPGKIGLRGELAYGMKQPTSDQFDVMLAGDINWQAMREKHEKKAIESYDSVIDQCVGIERPEWKSWEEVRDILHPGDIMKAKEVYWAHPFIQAVSKTGAWETSDYLKTKEQFVKDWSDECCRTHAIIKDGEWYEKGSMGWWGCVSDEKPADEWNKMWDEIVNNLPADTWLTVVDCHI